MLALSLLPCYAVQHGILCGSVSVCMSVCLVQAGYCTKMAKHWIVQTLPLKSTEILVFDAKDLSQMQMGSSPTVVPNRGRLRKNAQILNNISL